MPGDRAKEGITYEEADTVAEAILRKYYVFVPNSNRLRADIAAAIYGISPLLPKKDNPDA